MLDGFKLRIGAVALMTGALALFAAQLIRPDAGHDAQTILQSVAASPGAAGSASLLYLAAAALLVIGFVALPFAVPAGRGSRLLYVAGALSAVGAVWYGVEAAVMRFADVLAASPDAAAAATQLEQLNAGFGTIAVLPWFFYLAPLGVAIALRRAQVTGAWLIGLWGVGFAVGFAANSPLGESVPALIIINDVLLSALLVAIGVVVVTQRPDAVPSRTAPHAGATVPGQA